MLSLLVMATFLAACGEKKQGNMSSFDMMGKEFDMLKKLLLFTLPVICNMTLGNSLA